MIEKYCSKCETTKPTTEFALRKTALDGLQCWCRDCRREYQRDYARKHRNLEKHRLSIIRYRANNKHKEDARQAVRIAIKSGKLVAPLWCQRCRSVTDLEAHHNDYSQPLDVEWLCTTCHGLEHREHREAGC